MNINHPNAAQGTVGLFAGSRGLSDDDLFATPKLTDEQARAALAKAEEDRAQAAIQDEMQRATGYFVVHNEATAAWVVDKLLSFDERQKRLDEQYLAMTAALKKDKARFEGRFLGELRAWFDAQDKKGKKSLALLTGTLAVRSVPASAKVVDEGQAVEWARDNLPAAVTTFTPPPVTKLDKDAVRKAALALVQKGDGEAVPGIEITEAHDSFTIKGPKD